MQEKSIKSIIGVASTLMVLGLLLQIPTSVEQQPEAEKVGYAVGSISKLAATYKKWEIAYQSNGGNESLSLVLGWSKAMSTEFTEATGTAKIDLVNGSLIIEVFEFYRDGVSDVWLVDNQPGSGRSVMPETGDRMEYVGSLKNENGFARLQATLHRSSFINFNLDLIVVAQGGEKPGSGGILFGSPTLFQRLYHSAVKSEIGVTLYPVGSPKVATVNASLGANFLSTLFAKSESSMTFDMPDLIEEGRDLFVNEEFNGNGRTCASCHRLENNLTIDPEFIATLPPDDPLFVAEFNDSLNHNLNGGRFFENPVLMRQFGLIVENQDGADDLANKFNMRGVPHVLGQTNSLKPLTFIPDGSTTPPNQRTGWSGDGAPGGGALRDFATGAVTQHFPKTLKRQPGSDFRLPTESELDALEAFQLSTGRQRELDLSAMSFPDPDVAAGLTLFNGNAKCSRCHFNAGSNFFLAPDQNGNFDTGVENFSNPADATGELIPRDGGFGKTPNGDGQGGFGNGTFNTPVLVEAGDTPPFFHNNSVDDLNPAVAFYSSTEFNNSPGGLAVGGVSLTDNEVFQVTAFLYILNVLENIRASSELLKESQTATVQSKSRAALALSVAENDDAIESMENSGVQPDVVEDLEHVAFHIDIALNTNDRSKKTSHIKRALNHYDDIRDELVEIDAVQIAGDWTSGFSHPIESGNNRALIFTAHAEHNKPISLVDVSFGGQSMTLVRDKLVGRGRFYAYVAAFVLDKAGIAAATDGAFSVSWSRTPSRKPGFSSVFLTGVDQADPIGASARNASGDFFSFSAGGTPFFNQPFLLQDPFQFLSFGSSTISTKSLSTSAGDMAIVAATSGKTGSYRVNNFFTEGIELRMESADGVTGFKSARGQKVRPSVTQFGANRQVIIGFVVNNENGGLLKLAEEIAEVEEIPSEFSLSQNYPNPFNPTTEIQFQLPEAGNVVMKIYNTIGQEVRELVDGEYQAGMHTVSWDGKTDNGNPVSSGLYFYQIKAGSFSQIKKMSMIR
jgi:hypothetical protein